MSDSTRTDRPTGSRTPGPLPHPGAYSVKRLILGPAIPTAHLIHERLGRSTALAIFSSDALSSVAYATEEMLRTLFIAGAVATAAFALIMPLSLVIVGVLAILMFSYRQTIKAYPSAGGAYIVTKDNFGLVPAQIAGVALLTDYVLTVAVSVSAGVSAIIAAVPALHELRVADVPVLHRADRDRQPSRGQGVGADLRRADVPVPHDDRIAAPGRDGEALDGNAARRGHRELLSRLEPRARGEGHGAAGGRRDLPRVARARLREHRDDRGRGHLERRAGVPSARMEERPDDAHVDGRAPRDDVRRHLVPGPEGAGRPRPDPAADGARRDRTHGVRDDHARSRRVLRPADRHHDGARARGQHGVRRLPAVGELPGRRRLPASTVHDARTTPGLLERHHRSVPGRGRAGHRVRRAT